MTREPSKRSQLAQTLIALRTRQELSHSVLAERASRRAPGNDRISAKTIGNIESDRHNVTIGKLKAIAAALGVDVWQMFLPPPTDAPLLREVIIKLSRLSHDDLEDIMRLIRKLPEIEADIGPKPAPPAAPFPGRPTDAPVQTEVAARKVSTT